MAHKALRNQMTREVKVNRQKLINTLKANKQAHMETCNAAMLAYKDLAHQSADKAFAETTKNLEKRRQEVHERINEFSEETAAGFSDFFMIFGEASVHLPVPRSYEDAYDTAIAMAEFDVRDELDLSGAEFQCFVRDVWDWSNEFESVTANYMNARK